MSKVLTLRATVLCGIWVVAACGGSAGDTTGPKTDNNHGITATGPGVLTVSPLDTATLLVATPIGALAPPQHVLPTDHVYLYFVDPWNGQQQNNDCRARAVRAAGSGVVTFVLQAPSGDTKIEVQMTKSFYYYYDHVLPVSGITVGSRVTAGDTIAHTMGRCPSMDLGVIDMDVTHAGYVNSTRYGSMGAHAVSPYTYFAEPLRSWLYSRVRLLDGVPTNKDGRIDWGVRGRLVGDWFHSSIANYDASTSVGPNGWPKTIAFAYDWFDNHSPRISIGGTIATPGLLRIGVSDLDPATVSTASGVVAYETTPTLGRIASGWLLVQMLSDTRIRAEYFPEATTRPAAFTNAAEEYVR